MKRLLLLTTIAAMLAAPVLAQTSDTAPVDINNLLEKLKKLRDINEGGMKTRRMNAYQTVAEKAATPEKAVAYWKEAVKAVQFEGAEKEGAQIRDWREGEGEALNDRLCSGAVRLHLQWMALSLQHAAGAEVKVLLPKILDHIAAVQADELAADHLEEQLEKAKDRNTSSPGARKALREDSVVRKVHDQIMRTEITRGPVGKWMRVSDLLESNAGRIKGKDLKEVSVSWEYTPGNIDGIYTSIILPEYRATKDGRLLDYWDMVLKREADRVAEKKLDVELRDWNQVKKPKLQWYRAQDVLLLGYRNKAISDMFNIVSAFPTHAEASTWISQLEGLLAPPPGLASEPPVTPPVPPAGIPRVAPPATVPSAVPGVRPAPPVPPATTRPATPAGVVPSR